jgi:hypothetical protein
MPPGFRFVVRAAALAALASVACASVERLPVLDRQFYYNLESEDDREAFLRLKDSERQAFLEQRGLWQRWTELSAEERDAVKTGDVQVGYKEFAAHMAWGPPAQTRQAEARGRNIRVETYHRCTSGPRVGRYVQSNLDCDGTSAEVEIAVENGRVTQIKHLD